MIVFSSVGDDSMQVIRSVMMRQNQRVTPRIQAGAGRAMSGAALHPERDNACRLDASDSVDAHPLGAK
ncbi:hypothetical protein WAE61_20250 [Comamonadaceae bacterium PP-2]